MRKVCPIYNFGCNLRSLDLGPSTRTLWRGFFNNETCRFFGGSAQPKEEKNAQHHRHAHRHHGLHRSHRPCRLHTFHGDDLHRRHRRPRPLSAALAHMAWILPEKMGEVLERNERAPNGSAADPKPASADQVANYELRLPLVRAPRTGIPNYSDNS